MPSDILPPSPPQEALETLPPPGGGVFPPPATADAGLAERLRQPLAWVGFERLLAHWRMVTVRLTAPWPEGLEDGPDLAGRLRGALGPALLDCASGTPSGFQLCFRANAVWARGLEVPKPFTLVCERTGSMMVVRLVLFGFAGAWAGEVIEALILALRRGVRSRFGGKVFVRTAPSGIDVSRVEGIAMPQLHGGEVTLAFRSPVAVRRERHMVVDGPALLGGLAMRICGLARWQDLGVSDDFAALRQTVATLDYDYGDMRPVAWKRWKRGQASFPVPMDGLIGPLRLRGNITPLAPLLVLGTSCHAGSGAVFGLGRYELGGSLVPFDPFDLASHSPMPSE